MAKKIGNTPIIFGDHRQPKALPLSHPKARWGEFGTKTEILPKGYTRRTGCLPLPCDIKFERDVPVKLQDGTTLYVDIYRPPSSSPTSPCPALIAWSPYGKQGGLGNQVLDDFPFRMGVPLRKLSELQKWEGPDPAYWVKYGYAVVNPDPRGVGKSGGDIYQFGSQEGRDGAEVVDWVGGREWCSGKVGLSGNSYLSISQWFIAAERPKYLAAIAPWEGFSDLYGETLARGGVLSKSALDFSLKLLQVNAGENSWENGVEMAIRHKMYGEYHDDKRAKVENIDVPAYVTASWTNPIHAYGTFRAYAKLKSEKWLRVHDSWEWPDYYEETNRTDLHRFFDHFLKGIDNEWPSTPRVRAKILDTANPLPNTGLNYQFLTFPPPNSIPLKLFLDCTNMELSPVYPPSSSTSYKANTTKGLSFTHTFTQDTILCGTIALSLSISLLNTQDSDVFVSFEKLPPSGETPYSQLKIPFERSYQSHLIRLARYLRLAPADAEVMFYKGPSGQVRVSRRLTPPADPAVTEVPNLPVHSMSEYNPVLDEKEIVVVTPGITPIGMLFRPGERLRLKISGVDGTVLPPVDGATLEVEGWEDVNGDGTVVLYGGGEELGGSFLCLPVLSATQEGLVLCVERN